MKSPPICYTSAQDGNRVAFHTLGSGPGVAILFPYHVNHLALNWHVPLHRGAIQFLARYFTAVNLDFRGSGLSTPRHAKLSLESFAEDIDAVLAHLGIRRVALCAIGAAGLVACHVASRSPDRIASLVLVQGGDSEANRRMLTLRQVNPRLEAHARGAQLGGLDDHINSSALAAVAREALGPESLKQWEAILRRHDFVTLARTVDRPTLCVHAAADDLVPVSAAQAVVEAMPKATLMTVPARSGMDIWRDRLVMHQIARFLAGSFDIELDILRAARGGPRPRSNYPASLSPREVEVLGRLGAGRTNQQIAEDLFISVNTVSYHLRHIFTKTRAANRTEAVSFAHRHGLLP